MTRFKIYLSLAALVLCMACSKDDFGFNNDTIINGGETATGGTASNDGNAPDFDSTIYEYSGQKASDADKDVVGTDKDFYWEANTFGNTVKVTYSGSSATVETSNKDILYYTSGAHVVIDMQTNAVSGVEIILSGASSDGSLKVYGGNKYKMTLNGVELTSSRGPAINSQCKKRIYVHIADGTTNSLTDCSSYSDDIWYPSGVTASNEDRKGAFFSEGNLIFSGTGVLQVAGKQKHGIASDGYMYTRPGVTIAVTEAVKNAIHIKGDSDDNIGVLITGGLIYTNVSGSAGKGINTDLNAEITGGTLQLNTSGNAVYDSDENDTSSAAGIKADGNVVISGGEITLKSKGTGGKGINSDGDVTISGGETTITTTGGKYYYTNSLTSSPKGVKADGNINISGGVLNISVTGVSDGSEGLESKSVLTIDGGEIYIYAYDDAINAASGINVNGGKIYAYAINNDCIDSNGYLYFNGGLTIAVGAGAPEESFDCDSSNRFLINGGTLVGVAGNYMTAPSSSSKQRVVIYSGIQTSKNEMLAVLDSDGNPIMAFTVPRTFSSTVLFFSSSDLQSGKSYTISRGGSLSGSADNWNGWYDGGVWSGGTTAGSFTSSSVVTTVGSSSGGMGGGNMGGGNMGGGPGGW